MCGLRVEAVDLPPAELQPKPRLLGSPLDAFPVGVVAGLTLCPLVVAGRGLGDLRQAAVDTGEVSAELRRCAALVNVAEVEQPGRSLARDRTREPLGACAAVGPVAHCPHHHALGLCHLRALRPAEQDKRRRQHCQHRSHADHLGTTTRASLTARGPPRSLGRFTTRLPTAIVVEPPPSRLRASRAPSRRMTRAASGSVTPALIPGARPSIVTRSRSPSARTPASVRGPRVTK